MNVQTISDAAPEWACALVRELSFIVGPVSIEQACALLKGLSTPPEQAVTSTRFDEKFYTRTSIFRTSDLEVLVMGWLSGQVSPPHNHKGSICAVKIMAGEALEVSYTRNNLNLLIPTEVANFSTGSLTVSEDEQIHQFGNAGEIKMVSLHVYSPPLHAAEIFPESTSILSGNTLNSMISSQSAPSNRNSLPVHPRVV